MSDLSPFDHRPDAELSGWLRETLSAPDDPAFVARVMARVPARIAREAWWDILDEWARPGIAAAAVLLLGAGFWLGRITTSDEITVASAQEIDADTLLNSRDVPQVDANLVLAGDFGRLP